MPIPSYERLIEPLLRHLALHTDGVAIADVFEALASAMQLTPEERAALLPSGTQATYKNRIGWAHHMLKRAGLSESPRRGFWRLTEEGIAYAAAHQSLSTNEVQRLTKVDADRRTRARGESETGPGTRGFEGLEDAAVASPEERIDVALAELKDSVARDLLENIGRSAPSFFEHLVLDLLHAMGYGTDRTDLQRVGGSGDGGIDGIISLDRLGLEKVYVQAKRWKSTVGSPEIQGFMGALQLQGATKGVFITTSAFTKEARAAASKARGSVVLVDGDQLSSLMIDHGVGVTHKPLRVPRIDSDYFEEV